MTTRSPFSVSSLAAHPPEIPEPTTMASNSVACACMRANMQCSRASATPLFPRILAVVALTACGTRTDAPPISSATQDVPRIAPETTRIGTRGRYALFRVRLRNADGLTATGQLLQPPSRSRGAAVLLQNGRELNSAALQYLPPDFGDVVVLSLDYPEELPYTISVGDLILRGDDLHRAAARIPRMFSLAADYLVGRSDVDPARVIMVATSFAVPFATQTAALDDRFANVALIYGAG